MNVVKTRILVLATFIVLPRGSATCSAVSPNKVVLPFATFWWKSVTAPTTFQKSDDNEMLAQPGYLILSFDSFGWRELKIICGLNIFVVVEMEERGRRR